MSSIKTYRKKPVEVHAIKWTGDNLSDVIAFTGLHSSATVWSWSEYEEIVKKDGLKIFTKEGPLMASIGDYIVRGYSTDQGYHFWPVKPDYFHASYVEWNMDQSTLR